MAKLTESLADAGVISKRVVVPAIGGSALSRFRARAAAIYSALPVVYSNIDGDSPAPPIRVSIRRPSVESTNFYRRVVDDSPYGLLFVDDHGVCLFASRATQELLASSARELEGAGWLSRLDRETRTRVEGFMSSGLEIATMFEHEIECAEGDSIWLSTRFTRSASDGEMPAGWLVHMMDVTERKRSDVAMSALALRDPLTKLNNRLSLDHELRRRCESDSCRWVGVALIDLNFFKVINDTYGHAAGDDLLIAVANRLLGVASTNDFVARLGGDEFVFVASLESPAEAEELSAMLSSELHGSVRCQDAVLQLSCSVGVAVASPGEMLPSELLHNADNAMYRAKQSTETSSFVFDSSLEDQAARKFEIGQALRFAIEEDALELVYQPIVDLTNGSVVAFEALARLTPNDTLVAGPSEFVPIAEGLGLMPRIGEQLLNRACAQLAIWNEFSPDFGDLSIAIKISSSQFSAGDFRPTLQRVVARHRVEPGQIILEIPNSLHMALPDSLAVLRRLRALGFKVAVDGFGTDQSSLAYLEQAPAHILKIDRQFVDPIDSPATDRSSLRSAQMLIDLATRLRMTPIAAGIHSSEQATALLEIGCPLGLGHFFGGPLSPDDHRILGLVARSRRWLGEGVGWHGD